MLWRRRGPDDVFGPYLPVDLTTCCLAAFPEADVGLCCSILAPQMTAVRTFRSFARRARFSFAKAKLAAQWVEAVDDLFWGERPPHTSCVPV